MLSDIRQMCDIRGPRACYSRLGQCLRVLRAARAGEAGRCSPEAGVTQQRAAEVDVMAGLWVGVGHGMRN